MQGAAEMGRGVFVFDRMKKGWSPEGASYVAFALHPLDDIGTQITDEFGNILTADVIARGFERRVRERSTRFALETRGQDEVTAVRLATSAWADYQQLAAEFEDPYYLVRFAQLAQRA